MAAPHSHSSTLFVTQDGAPMRFYVRPGPIKRQLAPLITHGGGVVCRIQEPGAFLLADPTEGQLGPGYISTTYVPDCVRSNRCLSPRAYRLLPPASLKIRTAQKVSSNSMLTAVRGAPGGTGDHKGTFAVDLTNKEDATIQGNMDTCTSVVTTSEEATGELENNLEQIRNSPERIHAVKEDLKESSDVDLSNKEEAAIQGNRETCTSMETTTKEATGEREDNMEQMGNRSPERTHRDKEGHKRCPSVDLTNKEEAAVQGSRETCISTVTTTKEATEEDHTKKNGITSPKRASGKKEDHRTKSPDFRSSIPTEATSGSAENLKSIVGTASSRDGASIEAATGNEKDKNNGETAAARSTCSGAQKKRPSLRKMDVEQTLNEDENYSMLVIPVPRTSTPASGNPNTVKDLETDTAHDNAPMKDGESNVEIKNRVEKQTGVHEKPRDETLMSVHERDCGQTVQESPISEAQMSEIGSHGTQDQRKEQAATEESRSPKSPTGQMVHIAETETGAQKYTTRKHDVQSADSQQGHSVALQDHKSTAALRQGRTAFTKEEDMAILLYIRDNVSSSCTVTGNILWKDMEKKQVLGRTWQAMKARYVKYLVNHKHKYKLPPKCPVLPNKNSRSKRKQEFAKTKGSWPNCDSTSTGTPQKCDTTLPSASADIPQKCDTTLPNASADIPQKCDTTLPIASADISQKCDPTLPNASAVSPQNLELMLPSASTGTPQKADLMPPIASTVTPKKSDTMLLSASADTPQNCDTMHPSSSTDPPQNFDHMPPTTSAAALQRGDPLLPSTSAYTHQSCSITQRGAFSSAHTLVINIASKEQSILIPRKRSSDPTNDDESSSPEKGNRMLSSSYSAKTVLPHRADSSDSEDLQIFEIANMEFEEMDDITSPEQLAPVANQTEDNNNKNSASHVDETPSASQASDIDGLQEAMMDMMREFRLDASCVTQAFFFNSGELGSTRHFLRTGTRPDGYPIWEPKDDLDLKRNNPKTQSHLINKYGADNVARRVAFLAS